MTDGNESIKKKIAALAKETPGWCPADQLATLYDLVCAVSNLAGDVVEVGSWCGRSASVLGLAAQAIGGTRVHCIDLFPEKEDWRRNGDGTYSFYVSIDGVLFQGCQ